ncbi:DUF1877 family protein [Streptomyces sp. NBC_00005]|uniref:DUF1877 family protein n=1 Tax=Streptomyces sp. NBC_00005 TaxID=2903609 RepID=UPI00324E6EE7
MSLYFHLRAIPPSALRNSANWLQRLFEDDWNTVRLRIDRHREEMLDKRYVDQHALYTAHSQDKLPAHVVLGGLPVSHPQPEQPPFLILTSAQVNRVADYLTSADFEALWRPARDGLLSTHGGPALEPEVHALFASTHRDLTAFYTRTAEYGDAVVKWLLR